MATESNSKFLGYQAWYSPVDSFVNGSWLDLQVGALGVRRRFSNQYVYSGKRYMEFNLRGEMETNIKYRAGVTSKTLAESSFDDLLGGSDKDFVFDTRDKSYYTNGFVTSGGLSNYSFFNSDSISAKGVFYSSISDFYYDAFVLRLAVDFDAGKIWFGVGAGIGPQEWDGGNPATGADPNYMFSANTPLTLGLSIVNTNASFDQRGIAQLLTTRETCRCELPSGFSYWDDAVGHYQLDVLNDSPLGFWFASPFDPNDSQILNNMGIPTRANDSSGNKRYAQYYNQSHYLNSVKVSSGSIFPGLPKWAWVQNNYNGMNSFPCVLSSGDSFTIEATVYIIGDGYADEFDSSYKGGSFLLCRDLLASQYGSITESDLWFGLSIRGRKLIFGVNVTEAATEYDIENGAYHIIGELDSLNSTVRLFVNGEMVSETADYTNPSKSTSYINIGSRRPYRVGGNFPGYFRDVAIYDGLLSESRKLAHYERIASDVFLARRVVVGRDPQALVIPSHIL